MNSAYEIDVASLEEWFQESTGIHLRGQYWEPNSSIWGGHLDAENTQGIDYKPIAESRTSVCDWVIRSFDPVSDSHELIWTGPLATTDWPFSHRDLRLTVGADDLLDSLAERDRLESILSTTVLGLDKEHISWRFNALDRLDFLVDCLLTESDPDRILVISFCLGRWLERLSLAHCYERFEKIGRTFPVLNGESSKLRQQISKDRRDSAQAALNSYATDHPNHTFEAAREYVASLPEIKLKASTMKDLSNPYAGQDRA